MAKKAKKPQKSSPKRTASSTAQPVKPVKAATKRRPARGKSAVSDGDKGDSVKPTTKRASKTGGSNRRKAMAQKPSKSNERNHGKAETGTRRADGNSDGMGRTGRNHGTGTGGRRTLSEARKPVKSRLKPDEIEEFRKLLLYKRAEMVGDVGTLEDEALRHNRQDAAGDLSLMPNHMADIGSDNWEQEFTLGLLANQQEILRDIDEALARIDEGTFGICLGTGRPISKSRLRAKPWAKYCIEYARQRELGLIG